MKLRSALVGSLIVLTALGPVSAQAKAKEASLAEVAQKLRDPKLQSGIAGIMAALSQAMLSMNVGSFGAAIDKMEGREGASGIRPDATLADMIGPDAERMPEEMSAKLPMMMDAMAGMAGSMEAMLPQLKQIGEQMKKSLPRK